MFKKSDSFIFKKLGFAIDQEGILHRFLREGSAWNTHLNNTKDWIKNTCIKPQFKSITIIGSGWLLDVPIDEILSHFKEIYLIDVVHPEQIKHKYRKFSHLHFIEGDITGGMAREVYNLIYKTKSKKSSDILQLQTTPYKLPEADLVVSLNILNQLDILLFDVIQEHITVSKDEELTFRTRIQQEHLDLLEKYSFCLISDWEQSSTHIKTKEKSIKPLVRVSPPKYIQTKEWKWNFDSQGLYEEETEVIFDVKAFTNF